MLNAEGFLKIGGKHIGGCRVLFTYTCDIIQSSAKS